MARMLRDTALGSREARSRLRVRGKCYWRVVEPGLFLGYRRLAGRPGTWSLRRYVPSDRRYIVEVLGGAVADDFADANGHDVLSFAQAQRAILSRKPKPDGPLTVRQAIESYLEFLEGHRKTADDARVRAEALILPQLGDVPVVELTTERLRKWLNHLAATPRRLRAPKGKVRHDTASDDPEVLRKRKVSANRLLIVVKAALSRAWREGRVSCSDSAWRRVEPFRGVDQPRLRFLTEEECRRLTNAAQGGFRKLVLAALWSACRFGELASLVVSDYHATSGTLLIRTSKAGRARRVWLTDEAQRLFANWCAGRRGNDVLLLRDDGLPWQRGQQGEPMRAACAAARITPAASFHTLRHTAASHLAARGVSIQVIAEALGHRDQRMASRYSHLAPSHVAQEVRANALTLGVSPDDSVVPLVRRP